VIKLQKILGGYFFLPHPVGHFGGGDWSSSTLLQYSVRDLIGFNWILIKGKWCLYILS